MFRILSDAIDKRDVAVEEYLSIHKDLQIARQDLVKTQETVIGKGKKILSQINSVWYLLFHAMKWSKGKPELVLTDPLCSSYVFRRIFCCLF